VRSWADVPLPDLRAGLQPGGTFAFHRVAPTEYGVHAEPIAAPLSLQRLAEDVKDLVMPKFFGEDPISHLVKVTAGATATLEFDVDPSQPKPGEVAARVSGRASLDGVPLAGAELQHRVEPFRSVAIATVAADGTFAVAALTPGE